MTLILTASNFKSLLEPGRKRISHLPSPLHIVAMQVNGGGRNGRMAQVVSDVSLL